MAGGDGSFSHRLMVMVPTVYGRAVISEFSFMARRGLIPQTNLWVYVTEGHPTGPSGSHYLGSLAAQGTVCVK